MQRFPVLLSATRPFAAMPALGSLLLALTVLFPVGAKAIGYGEAPWVGESLAGAPCNGSNPGNFGPYDYTVHKSALPVVENAHFQPVVEQLIAGLNAAGPTTDIDYTLKVCPNHHRALNSAMQFHFMVEPSAAQLFKNKRGYKLRSPPECYLQRAVSYSPNDAVSRMLLASFLHRKGLFEAAAQNYELALELSPASPNIEYNYGLLLLDLERYDEARAIAQRLYQRDFPLPGLKNRLIAAEQW